MFITDPAFGSTAGTSPARGEQASHLVVECHEDAVPPFVDEALQQLYGNLFSTLAHRRVYGGADNVNTYVLRAGDQLRAVWLYERSGRSIRVLNEGIELGEDEVRRFVHYMFAKYPAAGAVRFHAVQSKLEQLPFPFSRHNCLEDMVLTLPPSASDYLAQLGKSTRSYIQRYRNKLHRDFPAVRFTLTDAHELDERHIQRIIALNRARMAHKGKASINDAMLAEQITHLAMECGVVGALTIDGQLVAGTINYRVRDNYFLEVIAHDPQYNDYRLGTLCCYLTICECIARGGAEYHFLWGQDDYKARLQGQRRDLDDVVVYRSRLSPLLQPELALGHFAAHCRRAARLQLRALRQREDWLARALNTARAVRHRLRD